MFTFSSARQTLLLVCIFACVQSMLAQPRLDLSMGSDAVTQRIWTSDEMLGQPNAPVTVLEYASWTCPFCALFHQNAVIPIIKPLADEGIVRFIPRDFLLNWVDLHVATVARCATVDFFAASDELYSNQSLYSVNDKKQVNDAISQLLNLKPDELEACLGDGALQSWLVERTSEARELGINRTPTLFINGQRFDIRNLNTLEAYIRGIAAQETL